MRLACLIPVLVALAGCPSRAGEAQLSDDSDGGSDGPGSAVPAACVEDQDCVLGAATCCACPTFATGAGNEDRGCDSVTCPTAPSCPDNVRAACDPLRRECVVACVEMTCATDCPDGYAIDPATGCLSCTCAPAAANGCVVGSDCVETRKDCCGCAQGGFDIAVLAGDQPAYDQALACDGEEACPGLDSCEPGAVPACVSGTCRLTAAQRPANACSRTADCATPLACVVNRDPDASALGVGVCVPP